VTGPRRIAVVGLGNVLMGDDAFGPYVVRMLEAEYEFLDGVTVLDLGTPGLDLTPHLSDIDALIVVDTVHSEGPPGEIRLYRRAQILKHPPGPRLSPHDPGLKEALLLAQLEGRGPRHVWLVGVIPQTTGTGIGLSVPVIQAVEGARDEVLCELERLGRAAVRRREPLEPDIWWEEHRDHTRLAWP